VGKELLPQFIHESYEVHEWKHACAILKYDFPNEWDNILEVLTNFRIKKSWITKGGKNKSEVSTAIDSKLYKLGWVEKSFATKIVVDNETIVSPTHKGNYYLKT
jgi:hypothetical protein